MRFSQSERVLSKSDPQVPTGMKGTIIGMVPPAIPLQNDTLESLSVYEVLFDGERSPRRCIAMNLELAQPKTYEATIAGHNVRVQQGDDGARWVISYYGMPHSCGPDYFASEAEAKRQAPRLMHMYLGQSQQCESEEPEWTEVYEPEEERLKRLLL